MQQLYEIYNLALHVIGLATVLTWARKLLVWLIKPKKKDAYKITEYSMKVYNKHSFEHRQEIMEMSHNKLQKDSDGSKN